MSEYELRPHHGLCIAFFGGKGYDEEFTRNMSFIVSILKRNDPIIKLTSASDVICDACPNNTDNSCRTSGKVMRYDEKVLEICGLEDGSLIRWSKFSELVRNKILCESRLSQVCADCCWYDICSGSVDESK